MDWIEKVTARGKPCNIHRGRSTGKCMGVIKRVEGKEGKSG